MSLYTDARRQTQEKRLDKLEAKAIRKARGGTPFLKVWKQDLPGLLERGWTVFSHTPDSYGAPETWTLTRQ